MAETAASILDSVKKNIGLGSNYDVFDLSIMTHINTTFDTLTQLGIGPAEGFMIEDAEATWDSYLGPSPLLNSVKSYLYLKVKMLFDPPDSSFVLTSMEKQATELEWRILVTRDELLSSVDGIPAFVVVNPPLETEPTEIHAEVDGGGADLE